MYEVDFNYVAPVWGDIDIEDETITDDEVMDFAMDRIEIAYPEAEEIQITEIRKIIDGKEEIIYEI